MLESQKAIPSLQSTRRYQVDEKINIITSVKEVIKDAVEKHHDFVEFVFVNSTLLQTPISLGDGQVWIHPDKQVPVNQVWIQVPIDFIPSNKPFLYSRKSSLPE